MKTTHNDLAHDSESWNLFHKICCLFWFGQSGFQLRIKIDKNCWWHNSFYEKQDIIASKMITPNYYLEIKAQGFFPKKGEWFPIYNNSDEIT